MKVAARNLLAAAHSIVLKAATASPLVGDETGKLKTRTHEMNPGELLADDLAPGIIILTS